MSQKLIQDMIVTKKSIRMINKDGVFPSSAKNNEKTKEYRKQEKEKIFHKITKIEREENFDYIGNHKTERITKGSQFFLWFLSVVSLGVLFFLIVSNFSSATINITPRNEDVVLDDTFVATSKDESSSLVFEVMTISKTFTKDIDVDGEENLERKSIAKAMIYNAYSTSKQRLITNTRLESSSGLVYRIRNSVDVPGYKIVNGKKIPGSMEIEIIADEAGDKYNMKIADLKGDFKIPGFKGSPKYNEFYARLSTDATGGFIGRVKKVSDKKIAEEKENADNLLRNDLIKELYQKKPEAYEIFKDNYYFTFKTIPDTETGSDKYVFTEEATIKAIMFKKDKLATFIATNKLKDYSREAVDIIFSDDTIVSIISANSSPWMESSIKVKFSGNSKIVWVYDQNQLLEYVVGQNKTIINNLVNDKFKTSIKNISAIVRPQWNGSFPDKTSKIKLFDTIRNK